MKNLTLARGYAGLQAFIPVIKPRRVQTSNVQEVITSAPVQIAGANPPQQGRQRLLEKRNIRLSRRLLRQA